MFADDGSQIRLAVRGIPSHTTEEGHPWHDPEELWSTVASTIREVVVEGHQVGAVGVASMAESGLLLDCASGEPRTHVIPWHDTRAASQAELLAREEEPLALYGRSGLLPSFKGGLSKLLWLRHQNARLPAGALWLSAADYVVYRLTGRAVTDPSLAARTYAFRIGEGTWDEVWIRHLGFDPDLFPEVRPSGAPAGAVGSVSASVIGLKAGTPVAVSGHDHICALAAAGVIEPGQVLDSLGTAESLMGVLDGVGLGERELASGLAVAPHVLPGRFCWLGGLSAAGGSIEWLRSLLSDEPLSYERVGELLIEAGPEATGVLYFPYLSGSGTPHPDAAVRGAFVGLSASHSRSVLLKAALEGTAYEVELIRRSAERLTGQAVPATGQKIVAVGGGTKNAVWMQIKADVSGCSFLVPPLPEASALGAALTAGLGIGVYTGAEDLGRVASRWWSAATVVSPDRNRHQVYRRLYEGPYLALQQPLRDHARSLQGE